MAYKKEGWKLRFKETMNICSMNINEKYDSFNLTGTL
jgi:hypothetical protein